MGDKDLKALTEAIKKLGIQQEASMKEFSEKLDDHKAQISTLIDEKLKFCHKKIDDIEIRLSGVEKRVNNHVDGSSRVCNLQISGLPVKEGENLENIVKIISTKFGYPEKPECSVYRIPGNEPSRPIIVRFPTEYHKTTFIHRSYKAPKLERNIFPGYANDKNRVYIQHDLTHDQYKLYKSAMALKKEDLIEHVRIGQGNSIAIKLHGTEKFKVVTSLEALEREKSALTAAGHRSEDQ